MGKARTCIECGKTLKGRIDKKYCDHYCRNNYNNHLKGSSNNYIRTINNALIKNRRILEMLLTKSKEPTRKMAREKMEDLGFHFKYFTHRYINQQGKTYFYCYDYGYLPLENDWYLVVKRKE